MKNLNTMRFQYEELSKVILHEEIDFPLVLCRKIDRDRELKSNTKFNDAIKCGKKCRLLSDSLYQYCRDIQDLRNKIHIAPLTEVDNKYSKRLVNEVFQKVKRIIDRIEKYKS